MSSADMQGIANESGYHGEPEADPWLRVIEADRIKWQLALNRALVYDLWIHETRLDKVSTLYFTVESYRARSDTRRDPSHVVLLAYEADGTPRVQCDCEGWEFGGHPCMHAALALETAHGWPAWFAGFVCQKCGVIYSTADQLTQHTFLSHTITPRGAAPLPDVSDGVALLTGKGGTRT